MATRGSSMVLWWVQHLRAKSMRSGTVGNFKKEEVELYAVTHVLSANLHINTEYAWIETTFTSQPGNDHHHLELLHMLFKDWPPAEWGTPPPPNILRRHLHDSQRFGIPLQDSEREEQGFAGARLSKDRGISLVEMASIK